MIKISVILFSLLNLGEFSFADTNCLETPSALNSLAQDVSAIGDAIGSPEFTQEFCEAMNACHNMQSPVCDTALNYYATATEILGRKESGSCGLNAEEMAILNYYTDTGYSCVNKFIWNKSDKGPQVKLLVDVLNKGLSKLPAYKGMVRRGTSLPAEVRAQHKVGNLVTYDSFTSTSTDRGFEGEDEFVIFSSTGRPIMGFSDGDDEYEVLFPTKTKFKVLKIIEKNKKRYYVMKEVVNGVDSPKEDALLLKAIQTQIGNTMAQDSESWNCPVDPKIKFSKTLLQKHKPNISDLDSSK